VQAHGITLSQSQADLANERIRRAGLNSRRRVEVRSYRNLDEPGFTGRLNLYQTLLVKPDECDSWLPLTRADWYA
jgi:Mycolic acid cyclopropane synthetase